MKYVVFGGTGFIGQKIMKYLNCHQEQVMAISKSGNNHSIAVDITNFNEFSKIKFKPDVIINCASQLPAGYDYSKDSYFLSQLFSTNVIGGLNISKWALEVQAEKVINLSTLVVNKKPWPNPLTEDHISLPEGGHVGYAMSKLSQEAMMNNCLNFSSNINLSHLRLSAVYGEGMKPEGIIYNLLNKLKDDEKISLTNSKKNTVDFINVHDVCKLVHLLSKKTTIPKTVNLASGNPISIKKLAELLKAIVDSKSVIENYDDESMPSISNIDVTNLKKLVDNAGFEFIPLKSGLISLVQNSLEQ
jgi:UDP-glucose 4-epimerase